MKDRDEFELCARRLKSLADPDRLGLVICLWGGSKNVTELAEEMKADIPKISHHLGVLRHAGIVLAQKQGRFVNYQLHPNVSVSTGGGHTSPQIELGCCRLDLRNSAVRMNVV